MKCKTCDPGDIREYKECPGCGIICNSFPPESSLWRPHFFYDTLMCPSCLSAWHKYKNDELIKPFADAFIKHRREKTHGQSTNH